jgi:hypothetical protein
MREALAEAPEERRSDFHARWFKIRESRDARQSTCWMSFPIGRACASSTVAKPTPVAARPKSRAQVENCTFEIGLLHRADSAHLKRLKARLPLEDPRAPHALAAPPDVVNPHK